MSNLIYDTLKKEYLDSLVVLENNTFSIPWSRGMFEADISNKNAFYVLALCNKEVVAYCGLYKVLDESDITNIAVSTHFRRQGIASELLNRIFKHCVEYGIKKITLEVRKSNIAAIELYNKHGFEIAGLRKNYYADNHEDAILMIKQIKEVEQCL